jgi:hypothetical protein
MVDLIDGKAGMMISRLDMIATTCDASGLVGAVCLKMH